MKPVFLRRFFLFNRGFTLLEVALAMVVLSIALVSVFRLQSQSVWLAARTQFEITAPLLARKTMSAFLAQDPDTLLGESGDYGENWPRYSWKVSLEPVFSDVLDETSKRLERIFLVVDWDDGVFSYEIASLRMIDPQ
ncbi:MAG: prepilin-type N-terminal cleavage/methylation domain-containing protein [Desulfatibacillaceae bacterium]|nr:prepilin-type N-terminal cleavage/methylation domain-containing protein [Desulfatibacillaceae bacterium]